MVRISQTFYGRVEDHKLTLGNLQAFKAYMSQFNGQRVQLNVDRYKDTRSEQQNRYYWGVVIEIFADYFGMSPQETHEALKWEKLRKEIKDRAGNARITIGSTATMKTDEFEKYMADLRRWGAEEFQLNIPEPNEINPETLY